MTLEEIVSESSERKKHIKQVAKKYNVLYVEKDDSYYLERLKKRNEQYERTELLMSIINQFPNLSFADVYDSIKNWKKYSYK